MHVGPTGDLRIHALGIDVVPRRWAEATPTADAPSLLVPADARATGPRLVDYVEVKRAGDAGADVSFGDEAILRAAAIVDSLTRSRALPERSSNASMPRLCH